MKVGIFTGGGDCAGLNAVIRGIVWKGITRYNYDFIGFKDGWRGVLEGDFMPLTTDDVIDMLPEGGTMLGSSRTNPFKDEDGPEKVKASLEKGNVDVLIAIGGDDTLGAASKLNDLGVNVVGVPKTMDNDLSATEMTFGFMSAVQAATDSLDRLRTTARSHHRVIVFEVFGRYAGWTALYSGWAGAADIILVPEKTYSIEDVCSYLQKRRERGKKHALVVVAEGATTSEMDEMIAENEETDQYGHVILGGIGEYLADEIEERLDWETRYVKPGHIVRGGTPTAYDRILSTRYGLKAVDCIKEGNFGKMPALRGQDIVAVDLSEAVAENKKVPIELFEEAEIFFG